MTRHVIIAHAIGDHINTLFENWFMIRMTSRSFPEWLRKITAPCPPLSGKYPETCHWPIALLLRGVRPDCPCKQHQILTWNFLCLIRTDHGWKIVQDTCSAPPAPFCAWRVPSNRWSARTGRSLGQGAQARHVAGKCGRNNHRRCLCNQFCNGRF